MLDDAYPFPFFDIYWHWCYVLNSPYISFYVILHSLSKADPWAKWRITWHLKQSRPTKNVSGFINQSKHNFELLFDKTTSNWFFGIWIKYLIGNLYRYNLFNISHLKFKEMKACFEIVMHVSTFTYLRTKLVAISQRSKTLCSQFIIFKLSPKLFSLW